MRNRTITDVFEPVRPLRADGGHDCPQRGIVNENTVLNTIPYRINGHESKTWRATANDPDRVCTEVDNVVVFKAGVSDAVLSVSRDLLTFWAWKGDQFGLVGERSGLYPQKQRWSDIERATFSFGYGLMVTPLQLARVYATIGSYGVYRPLSITKVDPPVPGERIFPESTVRTFSYDGKRGAARRRGVKAAIKGYRIAIKTGTAKKVGPDGRYNQQIHCLYRRRCACKQSAFCAGGRDKRSTGG